MGKNVNLVGVGGYKTPERAKKYILEVLEDGRLSYGRWHQAFESKFAKIHGCRFAVFCNSGTSALHVALAAIKEKYDIHDGDEVIVPATTFISTSNIVIYNNLKPVFVDVDPQTYLIDPDEIMKAITPKTKVIIPVHLFGLPCDMNPIEKIAKEHGVKLLEDSCETMFSNYRGKPVGSLGDAGCFSTYIAHLLITGVGGLVTTNDPDLYILARSLINHGRDSIYLSIDDSATEDSRKLTEIIEKRFSFVRFGHSFRATEMEAALGLAQLEEYESMHSARLANARFLTENLQQFSDYLQLPFIPNGREHAFMMYPIVIKKDAPFGKRKMVEYLEMEKLIETRDMLPLINQPVYKNLIPDQNKYPVSKWILDNGFYVGCHQFLTHEGLSRIIEGISTVIKKITK